MCCVYQSQENGLETGINAHIAKPIEIERDRYTGKKDNNFQLQVPNKPDNFIIKQC